MHGLGVYKISRRAFSAGDHAMRRSVTLSVEGRREGHIRVRVRGVHVVEVVQRPRASAHGVCTSLACMWKLWLYKGGPQGAARHPGDVYITLGGKGLKLHGAGACL